MSQQASEPIVDQSFRGVLQRLEAAGELHRVSREVDARFELGAVLRLRDQGPAQLFASICGHEMPVVGNIMNSRARVASLLGVEKSALHAVI